MIIDEAILKDGMTDVIIAKLISRHSLEQERFAKLYDYYIGKHAICERKRSSDNIANNRIVCNHAKYIVDIAKSYLVGNPVSYTCSDGYDIEAVKNSFTVQDMPSIDAELEKVMSIYGKAYEMVYANEESQPMSVCLPPTNTFIVYGSGVGEIPLYGVHYYKKRDIDGSVTGVCCVVCDDKMIYTYENDADSFLHMKLTDKQHHCATRL
ncbi:MAG: phage portal protein [Clostridia bacterium]|nr:phage portal protein [Clostridia bacterium]